MRNSTLLLFAFFLVTSLSFGMQSKEKIEINSNWQFKQKGNDKWMPASVPGCVHTDLINNKVIDDPYFGINETLQQWIGQKDWTYKTSFEVPSTILNKKNVELIFKGLDTYAEVYLNDSLILSADNMFREWKIDAKRILKPSNNLVINFRNVFTENVPKWKNAPFRLLAGDNNDQSDTMIAMYSRKAQYHYGWDWGPRLITAGIWRPVTIEAWDDLKLDNVFVMNKNVNKDKAELSAVFEIQSSLDQKVSLQVSEVELHNSSTSELEIIIYNILEENEAELKTGLNKIKLNFIVDQPRLWWSNGLGEQHLYNFAFTVKNENDSDETTITTGIRSLELVREIDSIGRSFYVRLNGVPVFMKGANYIPMDNFQKRVTPERYEFMIRSAADANMNMLRVWGGGIYEEDMFYELCDKYGILIWQDFMFACAMYPGDDHFMESVHNEVIDNVKRIRNHPSIALYCGNNENQIGWNNWGWKHRYSSEHQAMYERDMNKLFLEVIPGALKETDSTRFYSFSSPSAGFSGISYQEGDIHYWGVWHGKDPFEDFGKHIARFVSEYGFQSYPALSSIHKFTLAEDRNLDSEVMLSHQRCMSDNRKDKRFGNRLIKSYMDQYYNEPKDFENYLYISQLLQAEAMTMAIEAHRRNMPECMGSLYWQINDCWPVASWSGIDYYETWKATHYFAKKAFNDVTIMPVINNDKVDLFIVSDKLNAVTGKLKVNVIDLEGNPVYEKVQPVNIKSNSSTLLLSLSKDELLDDNDEEDLVINLQLSSDNKLLAEKIFYLVKPKDLNLKDPGLTYSIMRDLDGYFIEVKAERLAKNVYLHTDDGHLFSDNFFDLLPGEKKIVKLVADKELPDLEKSLKVVSLIESF